MSKQFSTQIRNMLPLRSAVLRYGIVGVSVLLAFVLGQLFTPVFGSTPDLFFLAAVIFSVWMGDLRAGLLATLLSGLLLGFFFLTPFNNLRLTTLALIHLGIFFLVGFFINAIFALRRSEEPDKTATSQQLGVILQGVADGIMVQDPTGRLVYANYAAARLFGYPSVDAMLKAPSPEPLTRFDLFDEFGASFPMNSLPGQLALTGMRVPEAVIRFRNKNTREDRWSNVKARPIFDEGGAITLAISLFQDITAFKTAERRIQEERNRFEVTLASIGDAVIATDVQGRVTFLNPTAEELTGWKKERASGKDLKTVFNVVNEDTRQPVENPVDRVLREGVVVRLADHTLLIAQDGSERPIDDSGAPILDLEGKIIGVVLVFRDITSRKQAEQERAHLLRREQAARAQAEEANQLKIQFLAMISHELRTPLASIKGFATTLLAPDVQWEKSHQEEYIEIINQESDRLAELVEELLDISRLQAGVLQVERKPQPLSAILETVHPRLTTLSANHTLVLNIPADLPAVQVDDRRITQVLVNLVDNAAKYSPANTQINVSASQADGFIQVDVIDQGDGIPKEDRAVVFEAFRQIHNSPTQKGAGLGLAICKGLIEAHGGRIWIQDRPAPGTTISFTLPIAAESVAA